jgi:type IV secretory pathway VirJ component
MLFPSLLVAGDSTFAASIRGSHQVLARLASTGSAPAAVIFLPGDGGWSGLAVTMGQTIASWGYCVYGFDTRKYLEAFSQEGRQLTREQMAEDLRTTVQQVAAASGRRVILSGWSQGAAMAVAAASDQSLKGRDQLAGVVTLGLPESAVLGWDWKATLAVIARREPDQPHFSVAPLLPKVTPKPIWMIHGDDDEYSTPHVARTLYQSAAEPKHLDEIAGAGHRFDGHRDEFYRSLKRGLQWIAAQ